MTPKNQNLYYVYTHRHPETREIFYVGMGQKSRAWDSSTRNRDHKKVLLDYMLQGYIPEDFVQIEARNLTFDEARNLEKETLMALPNDGLVNKVLARLSKAELGEIASLYDSGLSYTDIADRLGIDRKCVAVALQKTGIKPRACYKKRQTKYDHAQILELLEQINCPSKVADKLGCSYSLVCSVARQHNPDYRGSVRGWRKYDPNHIQFLIKTGKSYKQIKEITGASIATIKRSARKSRSKSHCRKS